MATGAKHGLIDALRAKFGQIRKLDRSLSLFEIGDGTARIYFRYSKIHERKQAFYGLRKADLDKLEGFRSFIFFLWDGQVAPLIVPYSDYEDIFNSTAPAGDGQYKVQVYLQEEGASLYIPKMGRFNVESDFGLERFESLIDSSRMRSVPELTHSQVQTLLGSIGAAKGFDVWVPQNDRANLDWSLSAKFECKGSLPPRFVSVRSVLEEVDVVWMNRGAGDLRALYEVEHSTPIYSGLLRFNDVHLIAPELRVTFGIVANDVRRSVFARQLHRPTFVRSGLNEICTFLEYANVYDWHARTFSPMSERDS
jgi:hypothetical protein